MKYPELAADYYLVSDFLSYSMTLSSRCIFLNQQYENQIDGTHNTSLKINCYILYIILFLILTINASSPASFTLFTTNSDIWLSHLFWFSNSHSTQWYLFFVTTPNLSSTLLSVKLPLGHTVILVLFYIFIFYFNLYHISYWLLPPHSVHIMRYQHWLYSMTSSRMIASHFS